MLRRFLQDERGATAIEYGLIASLLFLGIVSAIGVYGDSMTNMYERIRDAAVGVTDG